MTKQAHPEPEAIAAKTLTTILDACRKSKKTVSDAEQAIEEKKHHKDKVETGQLATFAALANTHNLNTPGKIETVKLAIIKEDNDGRDNVYGDASFDRQRGNRFAKVAWAAPHFATFEQRLTEEMYECGPDGEVKLDKNNNPIRRDTWPAGYSQRFLKSACDCVDRKDRTINVDRFEKLVADTRAKAGARDPMAAYTDPKTFSKLAKRWDNKLKENPDLAAMWPGLGDLIISMNKMEFKAPKVEEVKEAVEERPKESAPGPTAPASDPDLGELLASLSAVTQGVAALLEKRK